MIEGGLLLLIGIALGLIIARYTMVAQLAGQAVAQIMTNLYNRLRHEGIDSDMLFRIMLETGLEVHDED